VPQFFRVFPDGREKSLIFFIASGGRGGPVRISPSFG
jgi:hypothetical protein